MTNLRYVIVSSANINVEMVASTTRAVVHYLAEICYSNNGSNNNSSSSCRSHNDWHVRHCFNVISTKTRIRL